MIILAVIQAGILESAVVTFFTVCYKNSSYDPIGIYDGNKTIIINYNILANSHEEINEALKTMYEAYMDNLSPNVSAVLVSATKLSRLRDYEIKCRDDYRALIEFRLYEEGKHFINGNIEMIDPFRLETIWMRYFLTDRPVFLNERLPYICSHFSREFMCIHRVSTVLKKCGQYQDLMLLSHGTELAYTYTDRAKYGSFARPLGQMMFHSSRDSRNIKDRKFDYTLVLDIDTRVPEGAVKHLMAIATAHPKRAIIQPAIKMGVSSRDSLFMQIEGLRCEIFAPMASAMAHVFGQCGFFGKGLINNRLYIKRVIGSRVHLLEKIPVDILSHDTYEGAILRPLYAPNVHLLEAPCYNYISWNIREQRWCRGEVISAMYFNRWFGKIMRMLQNAFRKTTIPKVRSKVQMDFVTAYIANGPFRDMLVKPLLLLYILIHITATMHYYYIPLFVAMFLVLVFPKFAVISHKNWKAVIVETTVSILQFTPEAIVGCARLFRALESTLCSSCCVWIPHKFIEDKLRLSNPFKMSLQFLWVYSFFAMFVMAAFIPILSSSKFLYFMLICVFLLPLYCAVTSLPGDLSCAMIGRNIRREEFLDDDAIDLVTPQHMTYGVDISKRGWMRMPDLHPAASKRSQHWTQLGADTGNFTYSAHIV